MGGRRLLISLHTPGLRAPLQSPVAQASWLSNCRSSRGLTVENGVAKDGLAAADHSEKIATKFCLKKHFSNFKSTKSGVAKELLECKGRDSFHYISVLPISNLELPFMSIDKVHIGKA